MICFTFYSLCYKLVLTITVVKQSPSHHNHCFFFFSLFVTGGDSILLQFQLKEYDNFLSNSCKQSTSQDFFASVNIYHHFSTIYFHVFFWGGGLIFPFFFFFFLYFTFAILPLILSFSPWISICIYFRFKWISTKLIELIAFKISKK